jgi:hypothetical protein
VIRPSPRAAAALGIELARLNPARGRASAEAGKEDGQVAGPIF